MKTLRIVSFIALALTFITIVRCSDSKSDPTPLGSLSGTVSYTNAAGTATNAVGAVVTLVGTTKVYSAVTDATGKYQFAKLDAGAYDVSASFYTEPTNTGGRLNGLNFATEADVAVTMASTDIAQNLTLVNKGQSGTDLDAINIDYDWNGTAYANAVGALTYDNTHSPVGFEFAYRGKEADFFGGFAQLKKCKINFDVTNPTAGTIDVVVDLASFDTRSPGGRDPRTTVADNPPFSPTTLFTEYGCIINSTFGVVTDAGVAPTDGTPQLITGSTRYASFTATSIAKLGDGFVAKGNLVFHGLTVPIEMWFKQVPCWTNTAATPNRRYFSLEGKFLMDAKNKWNIVSSSLNDAIVRMQISIIAYKDL